MGLLGPSNKKSKKLKKKIKIPKTVQQSIPYLYTYEDRGIIETKEGVFTKSYLLKDINYQVAKEQDQQEMFDKYGELLNSFDSSLRPQICINNKNINKEKVRQDTLFQLLGDDKDEFREEFNQILIDKMSEGRNNMTREKYLTISLEADSYEDAVLNFSRLDTQVITNIKKIGGSDAIELSTQKRLEILHDIYNSGEEGTFGIKKIKNDNIEISAFSFKEMRKQGLTTKDCIAPDFLSFKSDYIMIGDKFARVLYLKDIASILADNFLSSLTNENCNMLTSIQLEPLAMDKAAKLVKSQLTNFNSSMLQKQQKASKGGYSAELISPELQMRIEEAKAVLTSLTRDNQKMFLMTFTITHFADTKEQLDIDTDSIMSTARQAVCEIKKLYYQQEAGFNTSLPLANNQLEIKRSLTTQQAAVFMPYVSQELMQSNGFYYGLNAVSKNILMIDRKQLKNGNGMIFGQPGGGKSFAAKMEMFNVLLGTNDDLIVIDPEAEYGPFAERLGGQVVRIAKGSNVHINPLDMNLNYEGSDDPIAIKTDFVISLVEAIKKSELTPIELTIIDKCCKTLYSRVLDLADPITQKIRPEDQPTLSDLKDLINDQRGIEARNLAECIAFYTDGTLDNFAKRTDVNYNSRFVVYDIRDLGSTMQSVGLLITLDNIWNRILENRRKGKYTWVIIDEIYLLFKTPNSAIFFKELWKRSRKYYGICTGITQNITEVLDNPIARTMISNSEFVQMLSQGYQDKLKLAELLDISNTNLGYISNSAPGEGLLYVGGSSIVPFINNFPKNTKMYELMSTKPGEKKQFTGRNESA